MFDLIRTRLQQGMRTVPFPGGATDLPERFRGLPVLSPRLCEDPVQLPSALVTANAQGQPIADVEACLFSPEEAACTAAGTIEFTRDYRMATSSRDALLTASGELEL
ncbi:MAG: hypothetical protein ACREMA_01630, partial [Longimicrobiales bacterium]